MSVILTPSCSRKTIKIFISLGELISLDIESLNDRVEDEMISVHGLSHHQYIEDISYSIVGHTSDQLTLLASFIINEDLL